MNIEFGLRKKSKKPDLGVVDDHKSLRGLSRRKVWVVTTSKTKVSGINKNLIIAKTCEIMTETANDFIYWRNL